MAQKGTKLGWKFWLAFGVLTVVIGVMFVNLMTTGSFIPGHWPTPPTKVTDINCGNDLCKVFFSDNPEWRIVPWDTAKTLKFSHCYNVDTWKEIQCSE